MLLLILSQIISFFDKISSQNHFFRTNLKHYLILILDDVKTSVASASVTYNETRNAILSCTISGCPIPTVSWSKNGVSLNKYGDSLALTSLTKSDAGQYSCYAQNAYTNSSSQIQVTVNCKYQYIISISNAPVLLEKSL